MKSNGSAMKCKDNAFEGVIVGKSNRTAVAAAKRVVAGPVNDSLNPIMLIGPSGSGKTRILNAIATGITSMEDGRTVASITGEKFFEDYIHALENASVSYFRDKFKMSDVLIIDGAEVFEKSRALTNEFLLILDDFMSNGRQIVVSLTKPFDGLEDINGKVYGRMASSAVLSLDYPDEDMKYLYIKLYLSMKDFILPDSKIKKMVKSPAKSFWEIKGALCTTLCKNL